MWQVYSFGKMRINVLLILIFCSLKLFAQTPFVNTNPFPQHYFIENKGQFEPILPDGQAPLVKPLFMYQDNHAQVAILENGFAINNGRSRFFQKFEYANSDAIIHSEGPSPFYFSYGDQTKKSHGYSKITFKNFYPHIDLIYEIQPNSAGFKYSFLVHPGGNIQSIRWQISPESQTEINANASMVSKLPSMQVAQTHWSIFQQDSLPIAFSIQKNQSHYLLDVTQYNPKQTLIIDPWVHVINNMDTASWPSWDAANKASILARNCGLNLQYDSHGNVYVYGGAGQWGWYLAGNSTKIAKYSAANGSLKWIFQGTIDTIKWHLNGSTTGNYTNFMVEPVKHSLILGQDVPDYDFTTGKLNKPRIVRLDSNGFYDGFVKTYPHTTNTFNQMHCDCIENKYKALGTNGVMVQLNDTGIISSKMLYTYTGQYKDIRAAAQDPSGNLFNLVKFDATASLGSINDTLFRVNKNSQSNLWTQSPPIHFLGSRGRTWRFSPYRNLLIFNSNAVAANNYFAFTFDGKTLTAYNKKTGKILDTFTNNLDTQNMQFGVATDYSNHIFVGNYRPKLAVFTFLGDTFKKEADIIIDSSRIKEIGRIQDVKYNIQNNLIYATGEKLVAAIANPYVSIDSTLLFNSNGPATCDDFLFVTLPQCDSASKYSFVWTDNKTQKIVKQVDSLNHFSDTLFNPTAGQQYTVKIQRNFHCKGAFTRYQLQSNPKNFIAQSLQFCAADTWIHNGFSHHRDTTFTDSLKNQFGCDSLIQYKLTFKPRSFTFLNPKICRGDSFTVGAHIYKNSGSYTDTFTNFRGCDSIVNTSLTVLTDTTISIKTAICLGDTLRFNNLPFFATGNYQIITSRTNGCDSVINLQLTVNPPQFVSQQLSLCNTDSFAYRNKKYPLPLSLSDTLSAFTSCDSVFTLSVISHNIKSDFSIDSSQFPILKFIGKTNNAKQWIWDFGDLNSSNTQSPTHSYVKSFQWISYKVCLVVRDSFGCDDTLCLNLPIKPEAEIQIPEGISPNGDGVNDSLVIPGLWAFPKASWVIFNRWGQVVFESNAQQNIAWDGRNHASGQSQNNKPAELLPEGVYYIVFNYNDGHRPKLSKNIYLKR